MTEFSYDIPDWLKEMIIPVLISSGKKAAIGLCKKHIDIPLICEIAVEALAQTITPKK